MFFQTSGATLVDYFVVSIKDEKIEDLYLSLSKLMTSAVDSLKRVEPAYYGNHQEIFDLVRLSVVGDEKYRVIKKNVFSKLTLENLISFIQSFVVKRISY